MCSRRRRGCSPSWVCCSRGPAGPVRNWPPAWTSASAPPQGHRAAAGAGLPDRCRARPAGGYRLGDHGRLPPLLLDDDEAVAVAVGLGAAAAVPGIEETSALALAKLEHVLPARLRRRVRSPAREHRRSVRPTPGRTSPTPQVDPGLLAELAARRSATTRRIRFCYGPEDEPVEAEPYRLVSWQQRWYVVARAASGRASGRRIRVDWLRLAGARVGGGSPRPLDGGDYTAFVLRDVAFHRVGGARPDRRRRPGLGGAGPDQPHRRGGRDGRRGALVLVTGGDSLEIVAVWIGMLGLDFHVTEPPELVDHVRTLHHRYARALPA